MPSDEPQEPSSGTATRGGGVDHPGRAARLQMAEELERRAGDRLAKPNRYNRYEVALGAETTRYPDIYPRQLQPIPNAALAVHLCNLLPVPLCLGQRLPPGPVLFVVAAARLHARGTAEEAADAEGRGDDDLCGATERGTKARPLVCVRRTYSGGPRGKLPCASGARTVRKRGRYAYPPFYVRHGCGTT